MSNVRKREYQATVVAHIQELRFVPDIVHGWDCGVREIPTEKFIAIEDCVIEETVKLK